MSNNDLNDMSELKRELVKYVRDYIKRDYKQRDFCYICNSIEKLELHHLYSVAELLDQWITKKGLIVTTAEEIMDLRISFYEDNKKELAQDNLYTLCKKHHERLHHFYGQRYPNVMIVKIKNWIEIQKTKLS